MVIAAPRSGDAAQREMPADHPSAEGLPPGSQAAALAAQLAANPDDFVTRKKLAIAYLDENMLIPAFEQAQEILAVRADDPDGLYISGVVRLAMGQHDLAVELLDRVLVQYPTHVLAHIYRGLAPQRLGQNDEAIASWERGLEAAGGRHPDLENLIAQLKAAPHGPGGPQATPPEHPPTDAPPTPAAASAPPPPAASGPRVYRVEVELPPGAEVTPDAVLFVSLSAALKLSRHEALPRSPELPGQNRPQKVGLGDVLALDNGGLIGVVRRWSFDLLLLRCSSTLESRRDCMTKPRVSEAPPWVCGASRSRTPTGFHTCSPSFHFFNPRHISHRIPRRTSSRVCETPL